MKFLQIFNKTPNYKKFNYSPRFYNPEEEERQERRSRIEKEVTESRENETPRSGDSMYGYRERMHGAFRQAKGGAPAPGTNNNATFLRLLILLVLSVGLIMYLQYGKPVLYGIGGILIALFLFSKYRNLQKRGR